MHPLRLPRRLVLRLHGDADRCPRRPPGRFAGHRHPRPRWRRLQLGGRDRSGGSRRAPRRPRPHRCGSTLRDRPRPWSCPPRRVWPCVRHPTRPPTRRSRSPPWRRLRGDPPGARPARDAPSPRTAPSRHGDRSDRRVLPGEPHPPVAVDSPPPRLGHRGRSDPSVRPRHRRVEDGTAAPPEEFGGSTVPTVRVPPVGSTNPGVARTLRRKFAGSRSAPQAAS